MYRRPRLRRPLATKPENAPNCTIGAGWGGGDPPLLVPATVPVGIAMDRLVAFPSVPQPEYASTRVRWVLLDSQCRIVLPPDGALVWTASSTLAVTLSMPSCHSKEEPEVW